MSGVVPLVLDSLRQIFFVSKLKIEKSLELGCLFCNGVCDQWNSDRFTIYKTKLTLIEIFSKLRKNEEVQI